MVDELPDAEIPQTDGWISACDPTFLLLVERYLSGAADGDELARLNQRLVESPVNREAFVHLATMSGCLAECFAPTHSSAELETAIREIQSGNSATEPDAITASLLATQQPHVSPLIGFLNTTIRLVPGGEFTVGLLLIVAVVGAFAGLATLVLQTRQEVQRLALDREPAPAAARLTATADCTWQSAAPPLGTAVEGKPLRVEAGIAEFMLPKGIRVVVEGPAAFEVESANRFRLDRGKLAATVPPQGMGFTVVTPAAEVIDLGTEFGVEVDSSDRTDIHVLKGVVEVKATHVASAIRKSDGPKSDKTVRLAAGEAVRFSKGQPAARIDSNSARFRQVLRPLSPESKAPSPEGTFDRPISFVADFENGKPGPHLVVGIQGGAPTVDFSGGTFAITSAVGHRIYLGTVSANYASVDFVFEATAVMPEGDNPWSDAFFGMGVSTPAGGVHEPAAPNILAVIRLDNQTANGFETRESKIVNSFEPASGVEFSPKLSGQTVRLRMTWNAQTRMALFQIDTGDPSGPFQPTYNLTVDGSDYDFRPWNSQLIFGGGNGLQFDDIRVTVTGAFVPGTTPAARK